MTVEEHKKIRSESLTWKLNSGNETILKSTESQNLWYFFQPCAAKLFVQTHCKRALYALFGFWTSFFDRMQVKKRNKQKHFTHTRTHSVYSKSPSLFLVDSIFSSLRLFIWVRKFHTVGPVTYWINSTIDKCHLLNGNDLKVFVSFNLMNCDSNHIFSHSGDI